MFSFHPFRRPWVAALLGLSCLLQSPFDAAASESFGAFSISDRTHCPYAALPRGFDPDRILLPADLIWGVDPNVQERAGFAISDLLQILNRTIQALTDSGDPYIPRRKVCAGLYVFDELSAHSYGQGTILLDPEVIRRLRTAPKRTLFSLDQAYLHLFAHQLQFWLGDPYGTDANSRRSELAADCVAAGLLAFTVEDLDETTLNSENLAGVEAVGRARLIVGVA